jgi:hypothetical protein
VENENIGTNLGLSRGLMALQGGHLLASRGGLILVLTSVGLNKQVRLSQVDKNSFC